MSPQNHICGVRVSGNQKTIGLIALPAHGTILVHLRISQDEIGEYGTLGGNDLGLEMNSEKIKYLRMFLCDQKVLDEINSN
jgi:hypothetical protein